MEKETIIKSLCASNGNKTIAAFLMGMNIRTMHNKLSDYKIDYSKYKKAKNHPYKCKVLVKTQKLK